MSLTRPPSLARLVGVAAVIFLLVGAGCVSGGPGTASSNGGGMSAHAIGQKAAEKYGTLQSYRGTVHTKTTVDGHTTTTVTEIWAKPHAHEIRSRTLSPPSKAGSEVVSNGSVLWVYNVTAHSAYRLSLHDYRRQKPTPDYASLFANLTKNYRLDYRGNATVAGRSTYVVTATPRSNASMAGVVENETLWLDTQYWFPLETHVVSSLGNHSTTMTRTFTNVSFGVSIPDSRFSFRPPDNATVNRMQAPKTARYGSVAAAQANVSYRIGTPGSLPDGFSLDHVVVTHQKNATSTTLFYANASGSKLFVSQTPETGGANLHTPTGGTTVTVDGANATYTALGNNAVLAWQCGGYRRTVVSPVSKNATIRVANSVPCTA